MRKLLRLNSSIFFLLTLFIHTPVLYAQQNRINYPLKGVEIIFVAEPGMFPPEWYANNKPHAVSLKKSEIARSCSIMFKAMRKYPDPLLYYNLKKIYILDSLSLDSVSFGGTNSLDCIYIVNKGSRNGDNDLRLEQSFHHEFSSILLRNNCSYFNYVDWMANNENVCYSGSGTQALQKGQTSEDFKKEYHEKGLLNEYSQASVEEDFNEFAQNLFKCSPGFWQVTDQYPGLRKKRTQIIEFYRAMDPTFTEAFFKNF